MQVPLDIYGQHFLMTAFVSSCACNHKTFANVLTVDTDAFHLCKSQDATVTTKVLIVFFILY